MKEIVLVGGKLVIAEERETPEPQARIRALDAVFCLNCESIFDGRTNRRVCTGCGKDSGMALTELLRTGKGALVLGYLSDTRERR